LSLTDKNKLILEVIMKKYFVLLIALFALTAGNAFAGATLAKTDNPTTGGGTLEADAPASQVISKMSKGVWVTANTNLLGYAIFTTHLNGSKAYGSAHDSTAIYTQEISPADIAAPTNYGQVEFTTLWTAL
jgi:hypothetical protein